MPVQTLTYRCPHCNQPVDVELPPENEMLVCPNENCHKPFKVEVPTAQPVSSLVLPDGTDASGEEAPPVAAPLAEPAPAEEPEKTLRVVKVSMWRRYPFRCLGYVLAVAAGVVGVIWFALEGWSFLVLLAAAWAVVFLYRFVLWALRMRNTTLWVSNKRCVLETGITHKQTAEVPVKEIDDIQINQTFFNRLLNVGDLLFKRHAGEGQQMIVMAVPYPKDVACTIRDCHATPK